MVYDTAIDDINDILLGGHLNHHANKAMESKAMITVSSMLVYYHSLLNLLNHGINVYIIDYNINGHFKAFDVVDNKSMLNCLYHQRIHSALWHLYNSLIVI